MLSDIRNILIIGRTGAGKSALANVVTNTNNFKESEFGVSETQNIQVEECELEGIKYKIFDTPGIGNTSLSREKVLEKTMQVINLAQGRINRIFFVTSGKFTEEEIKAFKLLRTMFGNNITEWITVVRTNFSSFEDPEKCENDKKILFKSNKTISNLVTFCDFLYVDNLPSTGRFVEISQKVREISRIRLLNYLKEKSQEVYELKEEILGNIANYLNKKNNVISEISVDGHQQQETNQQKNEQTSQIQERKTPLWRQMLNCFNCLGGKSKKSKK